MFVIIDVVATLFVASLVAAIHVVVTFVLQIMSLQLRLQLYFTLLSFKFVNNFVL
jgi:hypothetical protein